MKKQRITIDDVAQLAGVSRQTVSRAINNKGEISDQTRERVLTAVQELGYRPSQAARSLITQSTHTLGLLVSNITNPYFPELARGAQDLAWTKGYNVFLCNTDWDPEKELQILNSLTAHPVDGIIICSSRLSDMELKKFADRYHPIVLAGRIFEHPGTSMVNMDTQQGINAGLDYLTGKGHRKIALLAGPVSEQTMSNGMRVAVFRQAMQTHQLLCPDDWIVHGPLTIEGGYQSARKILTQHPQISALVAHNDLVAIGAIQACHDLGRCVPEDCAVLGFNDIALATLTSPALSTIRVDRYELGRQYMARLLAMLERRGEKFPPLSVPVELIIRESA